MISFPNCKINLGLRIGNRRADGYHNLISVFYPVQWCDALEMVGAEQFEFMSEGIHVEGLAEDNICVKAYQLLQKIYALPPVKMMLLKNIPAGAGLGGGSADGAFTLKMLNDFFELHIADAELKQLALQLGSDCPFFIENKPLLVTGKGEQLKPIDVSLAGYYLLIVYPSVNINTAWAFQEYTSVAKTVSGDVESAEFVSQVLQPPEQWRQFLVNDFETVVAGKYPQIDQIKKQLYKAGALYASMSGSGSAVYGIFSQPPPPVHEFDNYSIHRVKLS